MNKRSLTVQETADGKFQICYGTVFGTAPNYRVKDVEPIDPAKLPLKYQAIHELLLEELEQHAGKPDDAPMCITLERFKAKMCELKTLKKVARISGTKV